MKIIFKKFLQKIFSKKFLKQMFKFRQKKDNKMLL